MTTKKTNITPTIIPSVGNTSGTILCANGVKTSYAEKLGRAEFENVLRSSEVATLVERYQQGDKDAKRQLKAFIFCGNPTEESEIQAKERARQKHKKITYAREAKMLKPNHRFIIDIDHCNPEDMYNRFLEACVVLKIDILKMVSLIHITPSGEGLRIVMFTREGSSIEADQQWISEAMGVKFDAACKDISRLSFAVPFEYVLYYNPDVLFGPIPERMAVAKEDAVKEDAVKEDAVRADVVKDVCSSTPPTEATFKGKPLSTYINVWLDGKTPDEGARESTAFSIASDLIHITDCKADIIEQSLMPIALSWKGDDGNTLTEAEVRGAIHSACKDGIKTRMSKKMQEVLEKVNGNADESKAKKAEGVSTSVQDGKNMPPEMPKKMPEMIELITSIVHDYQKPACSTIVFPWLLTRIHDLIVRNADGTDTEIGLLCVLTGDSGVGKGAANMLYKILNDDLIKITKESWEKQIQWQENNKGLTAKERVPQPTDLYYPVITPDATSAALRRILYMHDHLPEKGKAALTHSDEIEAFYKLCNDGQLNICGFIKKLWDRDMLGAMRFSENSSNYSGTARINLTASCTPRMMRKFFAKAIEDGTVGRVDICSMFKERVEKFRYGVYSKEQRERLQWFLDNLNNYQADHDSKGNTMPLVCNEALDLHDEIQAYINEHYELFADDAYEDYAKRANEMAFRKTIVLYIANGCKWDETFADFYRWSFHYTMWNKTYYFGAAAEELLRKEHQFGTKVKKSPLYSLPEVFTRQEADKQCKTNGVKKSTAQTIASWKNRGYIVEGAAPDTFVKTEKCKYNMCA